MKHLLKYIIVLSAFSIFMNCKEDKTNASSEQVVPAFKKEGSLSIKKAESDSIVKTLDIEIADNEYETQTGLMYRTSMENNQGMLFVFPNSQPRSFYMKNTKIPLDIIYIDENKAIVSFQKNAQPLNEASLPSNAPAKYVLEINAGLAEAWGLDVGDRIEFEVFE